MTAETSSPHARTPRRALRVSAKALPKHNRLHNRSLVLQTLFQAGPMSRADLARESGLTRVTISDLVAELTADGIVEELGLKAGSRVGRPATLIGIRPGAYHILALDLSSEDRFTGAVVDLRGEVVTRRSVDLDGATGESALALVERLCADLHEAADERVLGIGVGSPGIVDAAGVVWEAPNLGWYRVPLGARLTERFRLPTHVGNDANAATLAVHSFEKTTGQSLMVVTIEHGVGAGLIIGGALVEGEQLAAGEVGHVVVDEDGDECACGRRGCLELALATPRLRARLRVADESGHDAILADAGGALGIALAPVVSALNLNEVVLTGPKELIEGPLLDAAQDTVRRRTMSAVNNGLEMRTAERAADLVLLGASVLVLSAELGVS